MNAVGADAATNVSTQMHLVGDHDIARVHVKPCGFPSADVSRMKLCTAFTTRAIR
ncbi:hypothetical protein BH23ACT10_BH23ACT10_37860 [soil metagenome]